MQANRTEYEQVSETLYHKVPPNDLIMYLLPKNSYHKAYGLPGTNYGPVDNGFISYDEKEKVKIPNRVAHFLKHKLFEKEGGNTFQLPRKQGVPANAFTGFMKTSYLFSTTDQVEKNLTTLIDSVRTPYFTEETVDKEREIIDQEIQTYEDDPN